jgi:hypothetical protein
MNQKKRGNAFSGPGPGQAPHPRQDFGRALGKGYWGKAPHAFSILDFGTENFHGESASVSMLRATPFSPHQEASGQGSEQSERTGGYRDEGHADRKGRGLSSPFSHERKTGKYQAQSNESDKQRSENASRVQTDPAEKHPQGKNGPNPDPP